MCWHVVLLSLLKQKMFVAPRFSLVDDDEGRFQHLFINFPMMNKKAVEFFPEPKMLVDAMLWYAAVSQRFTC